MKKAYESDPERAKAAQIVKETEERIRREHEEERQRQERERLRAEELERIRQVDLERERLRESCGDAVFIESPQKKRK
jgi:predicted transcriptional regulator